MKVSMIWRQYQQNLLSSLYSWSHISSQIMSQLMKDSKYTLRIHSLPWALDYLHKDQLILNILQFGKWNLKLWSFRWSVLLPSLEIHSRFLLHKVKCKQERNLNLDHPKTPILISLWTVRMNLVLLSWHVFVAHKRESS